MKKLIMSMLIATGLLFSVNASALSLSSLINVAPMPAAFALFTAATQVEYDACNDKPYRTVSHASGSNYLFDVSECDYQKNKDNYK